jgi:hypothetical protein
MKASLTLTIAMGLMLAAASAASAQTYAVPSAYYGGGYGDWGYHASTLEEGIYRGRAALAVGVGQGNYYNSLAAINNQEAYSRYLQNRQRATETYFHMRQTNQAAREAQRPTRLTTEQYITLARKEAPDRLSELQYDRTFGRLNWPAALAGDQYAAERGELEQLFRTRSPGDAGASTEFHDAVRQLTRTLEAKLKSQITTLSSSQYMSARKFLVSLTHESQQPLVVRALAAN